MGWTGGTDIFNNVYKKLVDIDLDSEDRLAILKTLIQSLWNEDWDTEMESSYFHSDPVVKEAVRELDYALWEMFYKDDEEAY